MMPFVHRRVLGTETRPLDDVVEFLLELFPWCAFGEPADFKTTAAVAEIFPVPGFRVAARLAGRGKIALECPALKFEERFAAGNKEDAIGAVSLLAGTVLSDPPDALAGPSFSVCVPDLDALLRHAADGNRTARDVMSAAVARQIAAAGNVLLLSPSRNARQCWKPGEISWDAAGNTKRTAAPDGFWTAAGVLGPSLRPAGPESDAIPRSVRDVLEQAISGVKKP